MASTFTPVILAAGKGSRMRSRWPKVMHQLGGTPLLGHVLTAGRAAGGSAPVLVLAPDMEDVASYARGLEPSLAVAIQEQAMGTGHAVMAARAMLPTSDTVVVLFGDTPFLMAETIQRLAKRRESSGAAVAVLGMELDDATGYGRLVMDGDDLLEIVEEAQATPEQRTIRLGNSGVMAFAGSVLPDLLDRLAPREARDGNPEYYLTDAIALARAGGHRCVVAYADAREGLGINDRSQLAMAEALLQARLRAAAMREGATLIDPATVYLSADTQLGRDVVIEPHVHLGPGVIIEDDVRIRAHSYLGIDPPKDTKPVIVRRGSIIGPFARLRSGADIGTDARIGNFVEVKNAVLGDQAKANHLTYLGDADIGARTNIGAGTITCNYDGFGKYRTTIGEDVFVGSNSTLVAPITIGDGALIGAGSWAAREVPADASHIARGTPDQRPGGASAIKAVLKRRAGRKD